MNQLEESINSDLKINTLFFITRVIFVYLTLIALEVIVLQYISNLINREYTQILFTLMDTLWVVLSAALIQLFLSTIFFVSVEQKKGKMMPNLIKFLIYIIIYLIAFVIIYKYILLMNLTSLLASMGVLVMVIGFAIQSNISNIFSGIALNLERTIEIDDWIKFEGYEEGRVKDINWRTTTVLCRDGKIIHIPNAVAADHPLINYSKSKQLLQLLSVEVSIKHNPEDVIPILLNSTKDVKYIVDIPLPEAGIKAIDQWSVKYKVIYFIDNYSQKYNVAQVVWNNIWENLTKAGIEPPVNKEEIKFTKTKVN